MGSRMINLHNLYIYIVHPFFERDYFNFDDSRIISLYNYDVKISFIKFHLISPFQTKIYERENLIDLFFLIYFTPSRSK